MYLHFTPRLLHRLQPELLWHMPRAAKTIYLTFDDGPVPDLTPEVLQILAEWKAKATFFCVGDNVRKYPQVLEQVLTHGHRIGNHTYHHVKGVQVPTDQYLLDVQLCQEQLERFQQDEERPLFRPPYGRFTREQRHLLAKQYRVVMWDVLSADYDQNLRKETCLRKSIRYTRPGSIIVFHDNIKARERLQWVLPRYLKHFSEQGYTFASL